MLNERKDGDECREEEDTTLGGILQSWVETMGLELEKRRER